MLAVYEEARKYSLANYDELKKASSPSPSCPRRWSTSSSRSAPNSTHNRIGAPQRDSILAAGLALQQAGVIDAKVDVKAALDALIDDQVPLPTQLIASSRPELWPGLPSSPGAHRLV